MGPRLERILLRVLLQLLSDVSRRVLGWIRITLQVEHVSLLVNLLHGFAARAERTALILLHFVLEEVGADVVVRRRRTAILRPN